MSIRNLARVYGKLRGGLQIMNREIGEPGTLGMLVTVGGVTYLISAKHVLAKGRPGIGDAVRQPAGSNDIAIVERVSERLDCAAARVIAGVPFAPEILHIGALAPTRDPAEGMRVIKAGASTGVTEGKITRIDGNEVTIKPLADFPLEYELSDTGDSGSVWVESESRAPVALHYSAQSGGGSVAYAIPMPAVLRELTTIMNIRHTRVALMAAGLAPLMQGWGPTGHRVVAEIAQRHLTPAAQQKVTSLLHGRSLADVANWPDELRSDPKFDKYKRLHFSTVPDGVKTYRDSKKDACGDLVASIDAISAFLKTGSRNDLFAVKALTDKSDGTAKGACNPHETEPITAETALRLLVHFMGDLHEPLHVGGTDLGGNKVNVTWMNRWQTNLHSTWDDEMVDYERLSYTEYAHFLDRESESGVADRQKGDPAGWADEAIAMRAQLYIFPDDKTPVTGPHLVSYGYTSAQRDRLREQLLKGGLRLAAVLNRIFE